MESMHAPQLIVDLYESCIKAVHASDSGMLDSSRDTLPILDHYVREMTAEGGVESKAAQVVVPMAGAYFGELVRRTLRQEGFPHAQWEGTEGGYETWMLNFDDLLKFNPIGVALEVVHRQEVGGWGAHFQVSPHRRDAVRRALDVFGDVRNDDYFRFSVRLECLEQAVVHLRPTPVDKA